MDDTLCFINSEDYILMRVGAHRRQKRYGNKQTNNKQAQLSASG